VRTPDGPSAREWQLSADAERVRWSPSGMSFVVSSEDGVVQCFDVRKAADGSGAAALWSMQAHSAAAAALDFNLAATDILATGGQDKLVKLWSVNGAQPMPVGRRNMQLGAIFDIAFSPDSPTLLGAGGASGKVAVWNTLELEGMQERLPHAEAALGEDGRVLSGAIAGMGNLEVNSSDDEDDEGGGRLGAVDYPAMAPSSGAAPGKSSGKNKAKPAADSKMSASRDIDDDDDGDDGSDDDDDDDEEEEDDDDDEDAAAPVMTEVTTREAEEAAHRARVSAALAAAAKKAKRGKPKSKPKGKGR